MTLSVWQRTIVTDTGDIISGADVEVREGDASGPLADLFADPDGNTALSNPVTSDAEGFVQFYLAGGTYYIEASGAGASLAWENVPIGTTQSRDVEGDGGTVPESSDLGTAARENLGSGGGPVADWTDGTTRGLQQRGGGLQSGPVILTPDPLRMAVEAGTGGRMTVLYDDAGYPNYMHVIPRFRYEDLGYSSEMGTGTATAFLKGGTAKAEIFVGVYQADSNAASLPHRAPQVNVDYDSAVSQCTGKGSGWHLMTAHEWAAIALWCMANGWEPRGNTDHGRAHDATHEVGVRQDGDNYPPGDSSGTGNILTGSGPDAWRHDNGPAGIADLVGNVWEWQHLLKIVDGEFFAPSDNDYDLAESSWPSLSRFVSNSSGTPTLEDAKNSAGTSEGVTWASTPTGTYTTSETMRRLLIEPAGITPQGQFFVRDFDERLPRRGGNRRNGSHAGLAALALYYVRSFAGSGFGFRPAFVA